jgi:ribosome recycling factor
MIKDLMRETQAKMQKAADMLSEELRGIRTGRASPALVERLAVEYYGTMTPLNQVATISAPEPRLLAIRPWEASMIGPIEKAILKSDLGLTPTNDGKLVRLTIPRLNEERRVELVRLVSRRVEESKVTLRNIRRDANDELKLYEDEKMITEDDFHRGRDQIQELTDEYVEKLDEIGALKEAEIREV